MAPAGREAVEDEGGPSDLQHQVETVKSGHQQADQDTNHCGHQSTTQRVSLRVIKYFHRDATPTFLCHKERGFRWFLMA